MGAPVGTPVAAASGNVANAAAVATLATPTIPGKTLYLAGFELTASGATAGLPVVATVTGLQAGTLSYIFTAPAGALVPANPLVVQFDPPLPAAAGANVVVTLPALGAGNTNAAAAAHGFQA